MPTARHVSTKAPLPVVAEPHQQEFTFPDSHHLVVATRSHIFAWDSEGIHTILNSSKNGIVAAKEAKDGSGVLAVADKHVVILHDTKRGQDRSCGLGVDEDDVRLLEYSEDAKSLFFSTKLTADIQCYSTETARLLNPANTHATAPVAFAVSPTGHLMVSASEHPPAVYLKNLALNTPPTFINPRASDLGVSVIVFHPERANVFLLAFKDGTIAAFDALKIGRIGTGALLNQEKINCGEIGRLTDLHRTTTGDHSAACITGASFLPGFKTRAVSVGSDGRCRLIDFTEGGAVLRTWHAKAPVTSVSVMLLKIAASTNGQNRRSKSIHTTERSKTAEIVIAVGCEDGKVQLYDSLGVMLSQRMIGVNNERVISVQWAKGHSLRPRREIEVTKLSYPRNLSLAKDAETSTHESKQRNNGKRKVDTGNLPAGKARKLSGILQKARTPSTMSKRKSRGKSIIDAGENEEGTVRYTPSPHKSSVSVVVDNQYLDLFSPMKQPDLTEPDVHRERLVSPPRSRPRISSQTFIKSSELSIPDQSSITAEPRNLALKSSESVSLGTRRVPGKTKRSSTENLGNLKGSPTQKRHISFKPPSIRQRRRSSPRRHASIASHNAAVLFNLRHMTATHPATRSHGILSIYAKSKPLTIPQPSPLQCDRAGLHIFHRHPDHVDVGMDSDRAIQAYDEAHKQLSWPEDSHQGSSLDDDIWLTSEHETPAGISHRRRQQSVIHQPPESHISGNHTRRTQTNQARPIHPTVDGSSEGDSAISISRAIVSPSGTFAPSSNDVRRLFPRTSSLSPRKRKKAAQCLQRSSPARNRALRELGTNATIRQAPVQSPWERAKVEKSPSSALPDAKTKPIDVRVYEDSVEPVVKGNRSAVEEMCGGCSRTQSKVHSLEGEVARLRGEVLALKAVLRRNGIVCPDGLGRR